MKKSLLLTIVLLTSSTPLIFAGTIGKVSGTITDAENREPLPGVNVLLEGTTIGGVTDINGYYACKKVPVAVRNKLEIV